MLQMELANGNVEMEKKKECLKFSPLPQRVLRLNRRGFYMSGRTNQNSKSISVSSEKADQLSKSVKSGTCTEKTSSPGNRKIKLTNSKMNCVSGTEGSHKRTLNGDKSVSSSQKKDEETLPKKKHKPITWP